MTTADSSELKRQTGGVFRDLAVLYDELQFVKVSARRLVELADLRTGERVLDVATGTGMVALLAAQVVGPGGQVVGVDLSAEMLAGARRKLEASGLAHVTFLQGDASQMEVESGAFDAVLCASALFFMPDIAAVLRECRRALVTGGRVGFSSFGKGFLQPLHDLWEKRLLLHGIERGPLPNAPLEDPRDCRRVLEDAGFDQVEVVSEQLGYFLPTVEQRWVEIMAGLEGRALKSLSTQEKEKIRAEHLAELAGLVSPHGLWVDVPANFAQAKKTGA